MVTAASGRRGGTPERRGPGGSPGGCPRRPARRRRLGTAEGESAQELQAFRDYGESWYRSRKGLESRFQPREPLARQPQVEATRPAAGGGCGSPGSAPPDPRCCAVGDGRGALQAGQLAHPRAPAFRALFGGALPGRQHPRPLSRHHPCGRRLLPAPGGNSAAHRLQAGRAAPGPGCPAAGVSAPAETGLRGS